MDQTQRVNRVLRYLCLDQYKESTPELITANIIKLRLLQSFNLDVVYLPAHPGFPHDGAVRIPQDPSEPERLIWFDFMVLLEDEPGAATRYGTLTMAQVGNASRPAFYIVIFPNSPKYMSIVPHAVAWQEGESDSIDIIGTGITGPYFPYLMPEHLLPLALKGISMIPWGILYTNPGTGVVLKRWFPVMTETRRDSPTVPLLPEPPSMPPRPSNSVGKKRRRDSDDEDESSRLAPALRERESQAMRPSIGVADLEIDASWTEHDLFGFDWSLPDQSLLSVLPETAVGSLLGAGVAKGQQQLEHIYPASPHFTVAEINTGFAGEAFGYTEYDLSEMWLTGLEAIEEGAKWNAGSRTLLPASQAGPATTVDAQQYKRVAPLRAIAPAPLTVEAGPSHISAATVSVNSPSEPRHSSSALVPSSEAGATGSESEEEDDKEDAPPRRLIELHHEHPWCNHIYLPPSTQDALTQLLAPDTVCLPVITNPSDTADGKPMPLSVLSIAHPCLHVLSSRSSPDKFFLLPSRWVDFFHCSLNQLLNSTQGDSKRSALRGTNKIVTENPTVRDAFKRYGIDGVDGGAELSWGLWDAWIREFKRTTPCGMTMEEDRNACCSVREVLQVQVDWSMRMFPDLLM
ncbi:unnamed protein product [Aureobasidium uvarum]|uniref:Uncharacterized protein n=1 Tax=Aureobasidium uvarum TaxID=2773716 RepID=A0A9N8KU68_9PEZI|nr:unnamed protein product [Aureobasidium uvarum]